MTAKFWTITGHDMWRAEERKVIDFTNLNTDEVVRCENIIDAKFKAVIMPTCPPDKPLGRREVRKSKKAKTATQKADKQTAGKKKAAKAPRKSEFKGVRPSGSKFTAQYWDGKKVKHLGTYVVEELAAAAVQDQLGNTQEGIRLRQIAHQKNLAKNAE